MNTYFAVPREIAEAAAVGGGSTNEVDHSDNIRVVKLTTRAERVIPLRGLLRAAHISKMADDLENRFNNVQDAVEGSGCQYLYSHNVKICMVSTAAGRRLREWNPPSSSSRSCIIGSFKTYPFGYRGKNQIIN